MFEGEIEADESYFGGIRKGKRGRGTAGKVAIFGLLKRNGKVYTVVVPNAQSATLLPITHKKICTSIVGLLSPTFGVQIKSTTLF